MGWWPWAKRVRSAVRFIRAKFDSAQTTADNRRHWANADHLAADTAAKHRIELVKNDAGDDGDDDQGQELQVDTTNGTAPAGGRPSRPRLYSAPAAASSGGALHAPGARDSSRAFILQGAPSTRGARQTGLSPR
jgi:hypothetical protein